MLSVFCVHTCKCSITLARGLIFSVFKLTKQENLFLKYEFHLPNTSEYIIKPKLHQGSILRYLGVLFPTEHWAACKLVLSNY